METSTYYVQQSNADWPQDVDLFNLFGPLMPQA